MSIQYKTISELRSMLDAKKISSKEIVEETFNLIERNSDLNAFITLNKAVSYTHLTLPTICSV